MLSSLVTREWNTRGVQCVGVDEAGRGAWAGPVVVAGCLGSIQALESIQHLNDSKQMNTRNRELAMAEISQHPDIKTWVSVQSVFTVDDINVLEATKLGMLDVLRQASDRARRKKFALHGLVDGSALKDFDSPVSYTCVVRGDCSELCIAAASVVAKVTRDRLMTALDDEYPGYGFARHKGYGTAAHTEALRAKGPSEVHRLTFRPIRALANQT
jgi:ribonuclease HII